jgi:uncharacterized protein YacL
MGEERLTAYIHQQLDGLDRQTDMKEIMNRGRLSFGIESTRYQKLPAWQSLVKEKRRMVQMVWITGFIDSLIIVGIVGNIFEKLEQNWWKALLGWMLLSVVIMLFYVIIAFYTNFYYFRKTEREVRRLIYQDILSQIKKEEKETV